MECISSSTVSASLPASKLYIPLFREFVADTLIRAGFSDRFAYRTEIIVDELCSNAIKFGSRSTTSRIEIRLTWYTDHIDLAVIDEGGSLENVTELKRIIESPRREDPLTAISEETLGLEIVKVLSEQIDVTVDADNITSVHIVRKRETI